MAWSVGVAGAGTKSNFDVIFTQNNSPYLNAYKWTSSGFGTRYANPSTAVLSVGTGSLNSIDVSKNGQNILLSSFESPYIIAYKWSTLGFGTKYSNPATLPTTVIQEARFNPANELSIVAAAGDSVLCAGYAWSSSGFGTKYANPTSFATYSQYTACFNPDGNVAVIGGEDTPYIHAWAWSSSGFGTKYSNPSTLITTINYDAVSQAKFDNTGNNLIVGSYYNSPIVHAYQWNNGFGTKYAAPATAMTYNAYTVSINIRNNVALFGSNSDFHAYQWNPGYGTKFAAPATTLGGTASYNSVFSPFDKDVFIGSQSSPYVHAYKWNNGFGTKYSSPTTLPTGMSYAVDVTNLYK